MESFITKFCLAEGLHAVVLPAGFHRQSLVKPFKSFTGIFLPVRDIILQ
jgi:hypothetical protein